MHAIEARHAFITQLRDITTELKRLAQGIRYNQSWFKGAEKPLQTKHERLITEGYRLIEAEYGESMHIVRSIVFNWDSDEWRWADHVSARTGWGNIPVSFIEEFMHEAYDNYGSWLG